MEFEVAGGRRCAFLPLFFGYCCLVGQFLIVQLPNLLPGQVSGCFTTEERYAYPDLARFLVDTLNYTFKVLERPAYHHNLIPGLGCPILVHPTLDQLLHLQEVQLNRRLASEERHAHADFALLLVDALHDTLEICEWAVY